MTSHASEVTQPDNIRSRMATAFLNSLRFASTFTDFLVHEGKPIHAATTKGLVPLSAMGLPPGSDFVVTLADIQNFFTSYVDYQRATVSATDYWTKVVAPEFTLMKPINRRLTMPAEQAGISGVSKVHLRVSLFQHNEGKVAMSIRVTQKPPELASIGLTPAVIRRLQNNPRGLLIITGRTSSGKTSTALSIVESLNETMSGHIITIEDPIELPLDSKKCIITQRQVGTDVASFGEGLNDAMRAAPDVILVSELRGRDSAEAAISGGESGVLMLVTTHGRTVHGTLRRILALCDDSMRTVLGSGLIAIIRQELVPHKDGSGYSVAHETLHGTDKVAKAIQAGDWSTLESICRAERSSDDFFPLRESLALLEVNGKLDKTAVQSVLRRQTV